MSSDRAPRRDGRESINPSGDAEYLYALKKPAVLPLTLATIVVIT
jgi:hypothetical protein